MEVIVLARRQADCHKTIRLRNERNKPTRRSVGGLVFRNGTLEVNDRNQIRRDGFISGVFRWPSGLADSSQSPDLKVKNGQPQISL